MPSDRAASHHAVAMAIRAVLGLVLGSLLTAAPLAAQIEPPPIPRFAVDVQGSTLSFKSDTAIAATIGVSTIEDLPGRGLGGNLAAHVYLFSLGPMTLGVGGNVHASSAGTSLSVKSAELLGGKDISIRFRAYSPQISFNFGNGKGWSYISGGISSSTVEYYVDGKALDNPVPKRKTINYGGGARWFMKNHMAFSFDIRFYAVNPVAETLTVKASPRMTLVVMSAGVSFK